MLIFGNDKHSRGCYIEISKLAGTVNTGAMLSVGDTPVFSKTSPCFISRVSYKQNEKFNVVQCFGDRNYVYAFGHDPTSSTLEVTFTAFLVSSDGVSFGNSLRGLTKIYYDNRLSKNKSQVTLSIGSCSVQGFWVGMGTETQDPEHNLHTFTAIIVITSAQNGSGGKK